MKKLLLALLLIPSLIFGQATGLVISNKASGGAIGTAAATVDVVTLLNLNQTTAGQTLTVPNLTNAAAGKIIYINNIGSVSLTLSPGGVLDAGKGCVMRWTGAAWNITGLGTIPSSISGLTTNYFPVATSSTAIGNSRFKQIGNNIIVPGQSSISGSDTTDLRIVYDSITKGLVLYSGWGAQLGSTLGLYHGVAAFTLASNYTQEMTGIELDTNRITMFGGDFDVLDSIAIDSNDVRIVHQKKIKFDSPIYNFNQGTASKLLYLDASKNLKPITLGSGLTLSTNTLTATGTGGTVTSVAALTLGTTGTDLSSSVANGTTTPVITLNVPTASASNRGALSSTDWSTFNSKESTLTFNSPLSRSTNTVSIDTTKAHGKIATFSDVNLKAPKASPTFTGTVTMPTPFTLGATSVTTTGTQLNLLNAATGTTGTTSTNVVFSTSPTLVTPVLGTPTSGDLSNCTGTYFTLTFLSAVLSPADATTYFFSIHNAVIPSTSATDHDVNYGYAFTVIGATITTGGNSTQGTSENSTLQLRNITQATSSSIGTFTTNATTTTITTANYTGLNISVAATDFIAMQWDTPTWATNPVNGRPYITLICKKN